MKKGLQLLIAASMATAVLLVFAHPATIGLPAPSSKYSPLLGLLLAAISLLVSAVALMLLQQARVVAACEPVRDHSDRLALICTRLC